MAVSEDVFLFIYAFLSLCEAVEFVTPKLHNEKVVFAFTYAKTKLYISSNVFIMFVKCTNPNYRGHRQNHGGLVTKSTPQLKPTQGGIMCP